MDHVYLTAKSVLERVALRINLVPKLPAAHRAKTNDLRTWKPGCSGSWGTRDAEKRKKTLLLKIFYNMETKADFHSSV